MKVLMYIKEWAARCGYLFNAGENTDISINNGYNCQHTQCSWTEKGVGCCDITSCPFGYESDETDCKLFGVDFEESKLIVMDIEEKDFNKNIMWKQILYPQRENKAIIKIEIFVDSNEEFKKFKKDIKYGLDDTLAIISNNKIQYELYAEENTLSIYKSEKMKTANLKQQIKKMLFNI
jgi:hypothetical protein